MSVEDIGREPCFWSMTPSSNPGYNLSDRERWIIATDEQGNQVRRKEKFPQRGHQGDYEDRRPAQGVRFVTVVRHDGHQVNVVLTNAAAHLDPNTPYGTYVKMKGRHLGWFEPSQCPAALIAAGNLDPTTVLVDSIKTATPCARGTYGVDAATGVNKPCPHCIAERDARLSATASENARRENAHKNAQERTAEAAASQSSSMASMLEEQRRQFSLMQEQSAAQIAALTALLAQNGIKADAPSKGDKK